MATRKTMADRHGNPIVNSAGELVLAAVEAQTPDWCAGCGCDVDDDAYRALIVHQGKIVDQHAYCPVCYNSGC